MNQHGRLEIVRVKITGRVQGVGYRNWLTREALRHRIRGWVRNRSHGEVEALLAGPPEAVATLSQACWQGPPAARVEAVVAAPGDADDEAEIAQIKDFRQIATL
ncbi:MAG TPA: acylphosphatase [Methylocella sp.]|nr:acylphosphatase [Methylocella sp.]